jgi:hypothetical protein
MSRAARAVRAPPLVSALSELSAEDRQEVAELLLAGERVWSSAGAGDPGPVETGSADGHDLPIAHYDHLADKQVMAEFPQLSQLELAAVESHERSSRPAGRAQQAAAG